MLSEVDRKKRDGRLGERARAFNRLVGPCTEQSQPHCLISGPPQVDIAICPVRRIDWDQLDDLDPAEGDDRITAEALHALVSEGQRLCILSYGRSWSHPVFALPSDDSVPIELHVRITAKNMRGEAIAACAIELVPRTVGIEELLDLDAMRMKTGWAVLDAFVALKQADFKHLIYDPGRAQAA